MSALALVPSHTEQIAQAIANATPESTARTYATGWSAFEDFCQKHGYVAHPTTSQVLAAFITQLNTDGYSPSTIAVYHAAVLHKHGGQRTELSSEGLRQTMRGINRSHRGYQPVQARALSVDEVLAISQSCDDRLAGLRDKFILLVGAALGLRYSDLANLRRKHIEEVVGKGLVITVPFSKTSDEAVDLPLPALSDDLGDLCGVAATRALLQVLPDDEDGLLMRGIYKGGRRWRDTGLTPNGMREALKKRAGAAGVDTKGLSNHSLRATFATGAYGTGISEERIASVGRWSSMKTQRRYNRASMWNAPASGWLGSAITGSSA